MGTRFHSKETRGRKQERAFLKLLLPNKRVLKKKFDRLLKGSGTTVNTVMSRLGKAGHEIEGEKIEGEHGYSLIMTEKRAATLPVEVNDCSEVKKVSQRTLNIELEEDEEEKK